MFDLYNIRKKEFEDYFLGYFGEGQFEEILNYSIEEGKRIRPLILLETYKMLGGSDYQLAKEFAISLELIHNYSLIHDDLPDMDNDNFRRGRKTTHYKYGPDMAILAGDSLLNYAFENIFKTLENYPEKDYIIAGSILSKYAGLEGMIGGQLLDIKNDLATKEKIVDMYRGKTCKLFMAATSIAGHLSHQDKETIKELDDLGFYIGMAFQLQDDVLDLQQDKDSDKLTYISFVGKEQAVKDMEEYTRKALDILEKYKNNDFLVKLFSYLKDRSI